MEAKPLVLSVDDLEDARVIQAALLQLWGYRAAVAADGFEAVEKARQFQPAVILLDLNMPQMDGFEAARRLKEDDQTRAIPLIAVSANAVPEYEEKARSAGFESVLTKPVPPQKLLSEIQRVLESS
jgi:CheY-like chemotaxis protein